MRKILATNLILILFVSGLSAAQAASFVPPVRKVGSTVVSVLKYGAISSDGKDDTDAFQRAINALPVAGGTVVVPAGNYIIDGTKSIKLRSNMHLKMDANAVLREQANSIDNSIALLGEVVHDVEISGGKLIGDRDNHMGTTGESGMGIRLRGGLRVTIRDIKLSKFWGDGIYVGAYQQTPVAYSDGVVLYKVVSTKNRRQGLSITNAINVKVYNSEFSYTQGTPPQYGIDIEPNQISTSDNNSRYAKNIEIVGCNIHHNQGGGIQFYRQVYNAQIKNNDISYNYASGLYAIESFDSLIVGNLFSHNEQKGLSFHTDSNNINVSQNIFRNNYTALLGLTNDTNSLVTIKGLQSGTGGNGTTSHIGIMPDAKVINVYTNQYAK